MISLLKVKAARSAALHIPAEYRGALAEVKCGAPRRFNLNFTQLPPGSVASLAWHRLTSVLARVIQRRCRLWS